MVRRPTASSPAHYSWLLIADFRSSLDIAAEGGRGRGPVRLDGGIKRDLSPSLRFAHLDGNFGNDIGQQLCRFLRFEVDDAVAARFQSGKDVG